jgi:hypothetical protein
MRGVLGAGAIALSLVLTACVGGAPTPTPTSTTSRTPTASPTPTPTPTPTVTIAPPDDSAPALGDLVLETGGFAQLRLSSDPALSPLMTYETLECGEGHTVDAWRTVYDTGGTLGPFDVGVAQDGLVGAIQVFSSEITTPQGIGPGDTRDDVVATYPGIAVAASNNRYDIYAVEAADGRLEIGVAHNRDYEAWDTTQVDRVAQLFAARVEYPIYLPGFHPIGASCI